MNFWFDVGCFRCVHRGPSMKAVGNDERKVRVENESHHYHEQKIVNFGRSGRTSLRMAVQKELFAIIPCWSAAARDRG